MEVQVQISLPGALKEWLDGRMRSAGFETPSALVEDLLRKEQAKESRAKLEDELERILDSEEPGPMTAEDWQRIRAAGRRWVDEKPSV